MPLLAREGEAPRLRVKDDGAAKASRWSRVAMMASGAVALGVVATHARAGVFSGPAEASLGLPVKVEEIAPYADQYKARASTFPRTGEPPSSCSPRTTA